MSVHDLPAVNATLNAISGVLLLIAYALIRARRIEQHRAVMIAALGALMILTVKEKGTHLSDGRKGRKWMSSYGA